WHLRRRSWHLSGLCGADWSSWSSVCSWPGTPAAGSRSGPGSRSCPSARCWWRSPWASGCYAR
ncbi:MAG: hypothetical protein AVDCRST_MAG60-618, partial [uncultured Nocardioides sp.]